jgi:TANFOR domain-containing protein
MRLNNNKITRALDCKSLLIWIVLLITITFSHAQTSTPINASISIVPPYSPYLSDYTSPTSDKLIVSLLLNDLNEQFYKVRLVFTIEGVGIRIQTKPDYRPTPINLQSGFQERLTADELAPYFQTNNLIFEGITRQQYEKNAALPEGIYKFTVQIEILLFLTKLAVVLG